MRVLNMAMSFRIARAKMGIHAIYVVMEITGRISAPSCSEAEFQTISA
jgi:hypothetical protein